MDLNISVTNTAVIIYSVLAYNKFIYSEKVFHGYGYQGLKSGL